MLAAGGPPIQMSANPPSGAAKDDDVDGCDHPPRPSIFISILRSEQEERQSILRTTLHQR